MRYATQFGLFRLDTRNMDMTSQLKSFIEVAQNSDFPIQNLPYGIFSENQDHQRRAGVALGEWVVDLAALEAHGFLKIQDGETYFNHATLNKFIDSGKNNWSKVRHELQHLLAADNTTLRDHPELRQQAFFKQADVTCICQFMCQDIPISTRQKNMQPMLAACSVIQKMHY